MNNFFLKSVLTVIFWWHLNFLLLRLFYFIFYQIQVHHKTWEVTIYILNNKYFKSIWMEKILKFNFRKYFLCLFHFLCFSASRAWKFRIIPAKQKKGIILYTLFAYTKVPLKLITIQIVRSSENKMLLHLPR